MMDYSPISLPPEVKMSLQETPTSKKEGFLENLPSLETLYLQGLKPPSGMP